MVGYSSKDVALPVCHGDPVPTAGPTDRSGPPTTELVAPDSTGGARRTAAVVVAAPIVDTYLPYLHSRRIS